MTETSRYIPQSMNYKVIDTLLHTHTHTHTHTHIHRDCVNGIVHSFLPWNTKLEIMNNVLVTLFHIAKACSKQELSMLVHHVGCFWKPSLCNKQAKIILGETAAHIVQSQELVLWQNTIVNDITYCFTNCSIVYSKIILFKKSNCSLLIYIYIF